MTDGSPNKSPAQTALDEQAVAQILRLPFWTPAQAQQVLQTQAQSGLSAVRFAARHRFSPSRLYNWRKRLETVPAPDPVQTPAPFVPVQVFWPPVAPVAERPTTPDSACWLCVRIPSGAQLRVFAGAPESLVHSVLSALVKT